MGLEVRSGTGVLDPVGVEHELASVSCTSTTGTTTTTTMATCPIMTEEQCEQEARSLGLQVGGGRRWAFGGDYAVKGCYAYSTGQSAGMAFFGRGGNDEQMRASLSGNQYRPCATQAWMSCIVGVRGVPEQRILEPPAMRRPKRGQRLGLHFKNR